VLYGTCRGRPPLIALPKPLHYILDVLHKLLRIVPKICLHTIHANVTENKMKAVMAQSSYDEHGIKIVIGGDIAFKTGKGIKNLSMY
jgi:hypothetical protein